jgi:uncharacterized protein
MGQIYDKADRSGAGKDKEAKHRSLRRCLVTGEQCDPAAMVRFVIGPKDEVSPDINEKLPGRGLWLTAERDMIRQALAKDLFSKAARRKVFVPDGLSESVERLLAKRCLNFLGLARRAGIAQAGFDNVQSWLRSGGGGLLLSACDGAAGGRDKIRALARGLRRSDALSATELGRAIGRDSVVHMVVAPGALADNLFAETSRLAGFRCFGAA